MRKLVIAVIVFSFLGFGPIKTFFHKDNSQDGAPIMQTIKESSGLFKDEKDAQNYLITEESSSPTSKQPAILLRYDSTNKKLMVGNVSLPPFVRESNLDSIKKSVEKNYNVTIDHIFSFNRSGIAQMIDLLAPNGISLSTEKKLEQNAAKKTVNGEEFLSLMEQFSNNPNNQQELRALFTALKNEILNKQSAEKWFTVAPAVMNQVFKNVNTDLGKGELLSLGLTAFLNPVSTIEPIKLKKSDQSVNSQIDEGIAPSLYN